ncbi:MAG: hypothetical protein Q9216_000397 [Gyalolechia sp. 2 TL-2023]
METRDFPGEPGSSDIEGARESFQKVPSLSIRNEETRAPSIPRQSRRGWRRRVGWTAASILLMGTVVNIAGIAFLAFLWFANYFDATWHRIILHNWLIRSVTIVSEVLKSSINLQAGTCAGMLAAVALEKGEVRFGNLPSITAVRSGLGGGKIFSLTWRQLETLNIKKSWSSFIAALVLLQSAVFVFSQFMTIILTGDIDLQSMRGISYPFNTAYGFEDQMLPPWTNFAKRQSTWSQKSNVYPAFAEYAEPPFRQEGVQDTGLTLRAFLPYSAAQIRQNTYSYSGRTTVLDSRVTCQRPTLVDATVETNISTIYFRGRVRASTDTPRLGNVTLQHGDWLGEYQNIWNESIPFSCTALPRPRGDPSDGETGGAHSQWRSHLCQLPEGGGRGSMISGGLISEFKPNLTLPGFDENDLRYRYSSSYGTAYLLINVTAGLAPEWLNVTGSGPTRPPYSSKTNEWVDLIYSRGHLILSSTLCYAAYDTADLNVNITSATNRTEPQPVFHPELRRYTFSDYRKQLGQEVQRNALNERQILGLEKRSWVATPSEMVPRAYWKEDPYLRSSADMASPNEASKTGNHGNVSAILWNAADFGDPLGETINPEPMHKWLFQEIIQNGGTSAFALQSLITLFSGMTYYDQVGQFNQMGSVSRADFVVANVAGHYRGFVAVLVFVIVQLVLAGIVLVVYMKNTEWSQMDNSWLNLSQAVTEHTERYLGHASVSTDEEIEKMMRDEGVLKRRVQLRPMQGEGDRVAAVMVDDEGGTSDQPLLKENSQGSNTGMVEVNESRRRPWSWESGSG